MKKIILIPGILFFLTTTLVSQELKKTAFTLTTFNKNVKDAKWLCQYDEIAWRTSDRAMKLTPSEKKRLGGEWFCYQGADQKWHAVYGKYSKNRYDLVAHYVVNAALKVSRVFTRVDTAFLNPYSRALITANREIQPIKDSARIIFNQYIKKNEDNTFTVWILPAFQQNRTAPFGGEFIFTLDKTGKKIIKNESYFAGKFKAFKIDKPKPIRLEYKEIEQPTLGGIFYAWYYKKYFQDILIVNKNHMSALVKEDDGSYSWIQLEK